jgi:hypothetical protein
LQQCSQFAWPLRNDDIYFGMKFASTHFHIGMKHSLPDREALWPKEKEVHRLLPTVSQFPVSQAPAETSLPPVELLPRYIPQ